MRAITSFYIVSEATRVYQVSNSFKKYLRLDRLRMSYYSVVWISFAISEKPSRMRAITFFYIVLEATRVYQVSHSFKKDLMLDHLRSYCHTESYGYCGWSPVTHYWPIIRYWSLPKHIYNSHYGNGVPEMFIF